MTILRIAGALAASLSVAACGGSGETTAPAPTATATIFDLNLPAGFDASAFPASAQAALTEFDRRNAGVVATGGPVGNASGNAIFFGNDRLGLAAEDGAGGVALVQGDVLLEANVASGLISGQFQDLSITDQTGTTALLGQVVRMERGAIVNGRFNNVLATDRTFNIGGAPARVTGTAHGAFVGTGSEAVGIVNGAITVGGGAPQGFTGGYTADQF